jgi:hypothetical protein
MERGWGTLHGGGKKNCRKKVTLFIRENAKRPAFEIECVDRIKSENTVLWLPYRAEQAAAWLALA